MNRTGKWTFVVLAGLLVSVADQAGAYVRRVVELRAGESTVIRTGPYEELTVQCTGGYVPPSYPAPGYPAPICGSVDVSRALMNLMMRRDRLVRGLCGYPRSEGFGLCEGRLTGRDAGANQRRFEAELSQLRDQVELLCRTRGCSQLEISEQVVAFDRMVSEISLQRIVFDGWSTMALVEYPGRFKTSCSGF